MELAHYFLNFLLQSKGDNSRINETDRTGEKNIPVADKSIKEDCVQDMEVEVTENLQKTVINPDDPEIEKETSEEKSSVEKDTSVSSEEEKLKIENETPVKNQEESAKCETDNKKTPTSGKKSNKSPKSKTKTKRTPKAQKTPKGKGLTKKQDLHGMCK